MSDAREATSRTANQRNPAGGRRSEQDRPRVFVNEVLDFSGESHTLLERHCELRLGRSMWSDPGRPMTEDELIEACRDADAVMGASRDRYTRRLFESCPRLQIVSKYGIGTEKIDVAAASECGVLVGHTPVPENYETVAEHTVALCLALVRRIPATQRHLDAGGWRGPETVVDQLGGKTVGLIGYGRIGQAVAARLVGFGVRLVAHDPYVPAATAAAAADHGVELVELPRLLGSADVVSVHVVATPQTRHLLGPAAFAQMKAGAYVVNTSRGEVVDEKALHEALRDGHLAGAALDVFDPEPPDPAGPLLSMPGVIATPHVAGFAGPTIRAIALAGARNTLAALAGDVPPMLKNPEAVEAWRARRRGPCDDPDGGRHE